MSTRSFWMSLLALACLSILMTLFIHWCFRPLQNDSSNAHDVDGFAQNAHYFKYNQEGDIYLDFKTPHLLHYLDQDQSYFTFPSIILYTPSRVPWYISAKAGHSIQGTTRIDLSQEVILDQPAVAQLEHSTIYTSQLTVYPTKMLGTTTEKALIVRTDSQVTGVGVIANLKTGVIELLSQSTGVYFATPTHPHAHPMH